MGTASDIYKSGLAASLAHWKGIATAIVAIVGLFLLPIQAVSWAEEHFELKASADVRDAQYRVTHDRLTMSTDLVRFEGLLKFIEIRLGYLDSVVDDPNASLTSAEQREYNSLVKQYQFVTGQIDALRKSLARN